MRIMSGSVQNGALGAQGEFKPVPSCAGRGKRSGPGRGREAGRAGPGRGGRWRWVRGFWALIETWKAHAVLLCITSTVHSAILSPRTVNSGITVKAGGYFPHSSVNKQTNQPSPRMRRPSAGPNPELTGFWSLSLLTLLTHSLPPLGRTGLHLQH